MALQFNNISDFEIFLNKNNVFDNLGIIEIGVFGSFVRDENANDIDLFVENVEDKTKAIKVKEDLERKLGIKIDLVFDDYANPIIMHRAKKDMIYVKKHKK